MTELYKDHRIIDGKPKLVILDKTGDVVNRNPLKEELKGLCKLSEKAIRCYYTDKELLEYLTKFYDKYGRSPTEKDFTNNSKYPSVITYQRRFGSWTNALKLVGIDVDSMVTKGIVKTNDQKARLAELRIIGHFKKNPMDLAGENKLSPCDGVCPNGKTYDVKSSKLYEEKYYGFTTRNKYREKIEVYYLLGFNEDYTILEHVWRVPGEMVERDYFHIAKIFSNRTGRDIESMKKYEITDKIREIINEKSDNS